MDAMVQTVQHAVQGVMPGDASIDYARLNPNFRYLRVTVGGRIAFLAGGDIDSDPRGPVEVWYSAQREVLRFQNGRLMGVVGLTTEWRNVSLLEAPSWSAVARSQQPVQWVRVRDVMPGYRYGVRDELLLRVIFPPQKSALQRLDPQSLTWFEERLHPEPRTGYVAKLLGGPADEKPLPPARYAVDLRGGKETVVYGEQCIAPDFCFTWQRWSAADQKKPVTSDR